MAKKKLPCGVKRIELKIDSALFGNLAVLYPEYDVYAEFSFVLNGYMKEKIKLYDKVKAKNAS